MAVSNLKNQEVSHSTWKCHNGTCQDLQVLIIQPYTQKEPEYDILGWEELHRGNTPCSC